MGRVVVIRHFKHSKDASSGSSLVSCLGIASGIRVIALVGAGGKTSLMYALAQELLSLGKTVVTTTTTKIRRPERHESPCLVLVDSHPGIGSLPISLAKFGHVTVAQSYLHQQEKLQGISDEVVDSCALQADMVVVEADGATGRPIKAPEQWEPVIPRNADLVIPVVGLDCIGRPAVRENVFRLERFADLTGVHEGQTITPAAVGYLLVHPDGALKGVPPGVPVRPFLNKRDQLKDFGAIYEIAKILDEQAEGRIDTIIVGSLLGK
jgi:probable selenium-dependent hydroxylase accessory protein YqeC